ncbi:MAG TPA: aminotransferase class V-fold PLP-dependent enzyme, partial [Longimicrobiales bacterium]|nr:aminotransferase class V-fold PLP-dependent enzyme [Longimicrobiales bacterium]
PDRLTPADFSEPLADARAAVASLVGADVASIALSPNTSTGINLAAALVRRQAQRGAGWLGQRRTIVFSEGEFPANAYAWLGLAREGWTVERVPADELGRPMEDALLERLDDDVAVLALSAVQFANGYRADLPRFGAACRERGILFVVDGIQAVGAVPVDVVAAQVDILSAGGQKWLCGPFGSGFTYARPERVRTLEPPLPGWLSFESSTNFSGTTDYPYDLLPDARRFEVGSLAIQDYLGLARSAELLGEVGVETIWAHIRDVQRPLLEWADAHAAVRLVSDTRDAHRSGIVAFRTPDLDGTAAALRDAGVAFVTRGGAIRLAVHFYNTVAEMEKVVQILEE